MTDPDRVFVLLERIEGQLRTFSAEVRGELATILHKIEAGDRQQAQVSELLNSKFDSFRERVQDERTQADREHRRFENGLNVVRVDLERQLKEHTDESGHKDVLDRLESLEVSRVRTQTVLKIAAFLLPILTIVLAAALVHWLKLG